MLESHKAESALKNTICMLPHQALQVYIHTCKFGFARMYDKVLYYPGLVPFLQSNTDQSRGMCECACVCWGWRQWGRGARWWWIDGVNTPAYMDWANIQFVPSRLSSTVAATQFLPIDLSATGTITPRDTTSPEYGAASSAGLTLEEPALKGGRDWTNHEAEMRWIRKREEGGTGRWKSKFILWCSGSDKAQTFRDQLRRKLEALQPALVVSVVSFCLTWVSSSWMTLMKQWNYKATDKQKNNR